MTDKKENTGLMVLPEVVVSFTPAVIKVNIDELRAALTAQVAEQSNTVVTVDNLQESKKLMASMNKTAGAIKAARIQYAKEAGVNISAFEAEMKELEKISADGVQKIKDQATRFEDETRVNAQAAMWAYVLEQFIAKGIQPEFQRASVADLVSLTALTGTGNLTTKTKAAIDERIAADLALQHQTENRLLKLELESHKAGLSAPLERRHVELFLYEPDDVYQMRLQSLFEAEKLRLDRAEESQRRERELAQQSQAEAEDRARKAEDDRAEAQRIQAEQQAKFEAERQQREAEHAQQLEAAKAQAAQQDAPKPHAVPISMGADSVKHAIGVSPDSVVKMVCTYAEACAHAATIEASEVFIWVREGLKGKLVNFMQNGGAK